MQCQACGFVFLLLCVGYLLCDCLGFILEDLDAVGVVVPLILRGEELLDLVASVGELLALGSVCFGAVGLDRCVVGLLE